jgi:UrcA family protein
MRRTLLVAGLALVISTGAPAAAEQGGVVIVEGSRALADNQRLVRYGDIQLADTVGQRVLRERIALAIADLCDPTRFSVSEPHGSMECRNVAWSDVQARLPKLRHLALR